MSSELTNTWLAIASLFLVGIIQECGCINCYTCSSVNGSNHFCEDPINTQVSKYTEKCMIPKKGHIGLFPANFCIKIVGRNNENELMVIRACAMKTMDSQCGTFKYQEVTMTGCVLTCDYDGCNASTKLKSTILPYIISLMTMWSFLR